MEKITNKGAKQSKKKKKCMEISIPVGGVGVRPRSISIQFLKCVEWSNSSRNANRPEISKQFLVFLLCMVPLTTNVLLHHIYCLLFISNLYLLNL